MLYTEETITLPVTLNNETRQVEFRVTSYNPNHAYSEYLMIARCGRTGTKRWPSNMLAFKRDGKWYVDFTFYQLNRNTGRVHSWAS